jgi:RimJ/RimL family protein N-acetyltransferase
VPLGASRAAIDSGDVIGASLCVAVETWEVDVLRGERVGLRARQEQDVAVLHAELYDDVATIMRSDSRPWRPIPSAGASPYAANEPSDTSAPFSVVELATDELLGEAVLWGVDLHNRFGHLGLSLRPSARGRGFAADVVRVLCYYGFAVRGLHRLQLETLADNQAMLATATHCGFVIEGTARQAAWVDGAFVDEVVLGLLVDEWRALPAGR